MRYFILPLIMLYLMSSCHSHDHDDHKGHDHEHHGLDHEDHDHDHKNHNHDDHDHDHDGHDHEGHDHDHEMEEQQESSGIDANEYNETLAKEVGADN